MTALEDNGSQVGRRAKASKGTVKIENDKGWLRLRFSFQGRRYAFPLACLTPRQIVQSLNTR
ncbi:hypothetical protein [Chroococcidiopsis sp [FACHB-1243]]|uniref:hypothetical protein n=1 Tax=Chroococcidiopsis sp. [FACHB-1243] TaxID=2692781 RepID=UPI0018F05B11|nr:hypothetical protein [Chroococcidiopsis sp. [FACHB-1243]]